MKKKYLTFIAVCLILTAFSFSCFAAEYYESSDESTAASYVDVIEIEKSEVLIDIPETGNKTYELTPQGNLSLIDDVEEYYESNEKGSKEFLTVTTKSGNTFYIVVDRDGNEDNVYLLNLVDEADLMALINDEEVTYSETETTEETSTQKVSENTSEKEKSKLPTIVGLLVAVGGGGYVAYKFLLKKKEDDKKSKQTDIDDEEEEYVFEDYFSEKGDENQ